MNHLLKCVCACALPGPQFVQIMGSRQPVKQNSITACVAEKSSNAKYFMFACTLANTQAGQCKHCEVCINIIK